MLWRPGRNNPVYLTDLREIQTCHVVCHPALSTFSDSHRTSLRTGCLPNFHVSHFNSGRCYEVYYVRWTLAIPALSRTKDPNPGTALHPTFSLHEASRIQHSVTLVHARQQSHPPFDDALGVRRLPDYCLIEIEAN